VAGIAASVPYALIYGLLFAIVVWHYDLAGRVEKTGTPIVTSPFTLGWDGRVALVAVGAVAGIGLAMFALLTVCTAGLLVIGAAIGLARREAPA
jgi:hypothetical protein